MHVNRKVLRDLLNELGSFDEEPLRCVTADGRIYDIQGVVREVDREDDSASVWFHIQERRD